MRVHHHQQQQQQRCGRSGGATAAATAAARCHRACVTAAVDRQQPGIPARAAAVPSEAQQQRRHHHPQQLQQQRHGQRRPAPSAGGANQARQQQQLDARAMDLQQLHQQLVTSPDAHQLNARSLSAALMRLARLRLRGRDERDQACDVAAAAWRLLAPQLGGCRPYELALVPWALAKLGCDDAAPYAACLDRLIVGGLKNVEPRHLCNAIWSLAGAPPAVAAELERGRSDSSSSSRCSRVGQLLPAFMEVLGGANAQDVSNVLWAAATLQSGALTHDRVQALLAQLTKQRADDTAPQAISNSLWAAAKLGFRPPPALLGELLRRLLARADEASELSASHALYALATMPPTPTPPSAAVAGGGRDGPLLKQLLLRGVVLRLLGAVAAPLAAGGRCNVGAVAIVLWSAAKLGVDVPPQLQAQLVGAFCGQLQRANEQDVSNVLWAAATQRAQQAAAAPGSRGDSNDDDGAALLAASPLAPADLVALLNAAAARARDAGAAPQAAANSVWAATKLGGGADAAVFEAARGVVAALMRQPRLLADVTPQELSNVLWAAAKLQEQAGAAGGGATPSSPPLLAPAEAMELAQCLAEQPEESSAQDAANALWGTAKLGVVLPEEPALALAQRVVAPQASSSGQEGCEQMQALWALATMQQQAEEAAQRQRQAGQQPATRGLRVPLELVQALLAPLEAAGVRSLPDSVLAPAWWAAARLTPPVVPQRMLAPGGEARAALLSRVQQLQDLQAASNMAWALGVWGAAVEAADVAAALVARGAALVRTAEQQQGVSPKQQRLAQAATNLAWAAAVLDLRASVRDVLALAAVCGRRFAALCALDRCQLYMAHVWLADARPPGADDGRGLERPGVLSAAQLAECRRAWDAQVALMRAARVSRLQQSVFAAVQRLPGLDAPPQLEALAAPDGVVSIDVAASVSGGTRVAIEADGPTHMRLPDGRPTGTTLWRNARLAARGYALVAVPFDAWGALSGDGAAEDAWLLARVREALIAAAAGGGGAMPVAPALPTTTAAQPSAASPAAAAAGAADEPPPPRRRRRKVANVAATAAAG